MSAPQKMRLVSNNLGKTAYLVALTPATICPLLAHEEVACPVSRVACLVCFTDKGKALQGEHRRISKANAPRAHPTAFGLLDDMQKRHGAPYGFAVGKICLIASTYSIRSREDSRNFFRSVIGVVLSEDRKRGDHRSCALRILVFDHDPPYTYQRQSYGDGQERAYQKLPQGSTTRAK
jgi:hypothetical protein